MAEETKAPEEIKLTNRQARYSEAFQKFICEEWADYDPNLPELMEAAKYTPERRAKLSAIFPGVRLVIPAGGYKVRSNDTDYRFRAHAAFAHLTGLGSIAEPDAVIVLEPVGSSHEPCLYFHPRVPRTDPEFYSNAQYGEMWVGQRDSLEEHSARCGIRCASIEELEADLRKAADSTPMRVLRDADAKITELVDSIRGRDEDADAELQIAISELRLIKDEYEIRQMREACEATARGFAAVVANFPTATRVGRGERVVEGIFGLHARHHGNAVGYETIAASGDHANTLHWIDNTGDLKEGDLLLMDAGVELDSLYTADVTRTLPVTGKFTAPQRKIYEAVLEAQRAGIDAAKPGVPFADVHKAAITVIAHKMAEWGLLPVSAEEALTPEGGQHVRWMVHGTSHHLGIDVHDCAQALRENYREGLLKEGMIITVEPGIYFKSTDLIVPEELRGIGVRIEDDIVITADGCELLSDQLPRDPDDVEAWMAPILANAEARDTL